MLGSASSLVHGFASAGMATDIKILVVSFHVQVVPEVRNIESEALKKS